MNLFLKGNRSHFNDKRLESQYENLLTDMINHQTNIINRLSVDRKTSVGYYRFYQNEQASMEELLALLAQSTADSVSDRDVLVIGDTTEISLKYRIDKIQDGHRVGVLSDNKTPGIIAHANIVLDADRFNGLGLGDLMMWSRKKGAPKKTKKSTKDDRSDEEKESHKWILGARNSQKVLDKARTCTFVFDQEADIFSLYEQLPDEKTHFVIRSHYDRNVRTIDGKSQLGDYIESLPVQGNYKLKIRERKQSRHAPRKSTFRKPREANIDLRFGECMVETPTNTPADERRAIKLYFVYAKESSETVPEGEDPVHWCMFTSHLVECIEKAYQVVQWYEKRWVIEQLFRTLKRKGFDIESTELEYLDSICKQTILSFQAAFTVMQLVQARDQYEGLPIKNVFSGEEISCLEVLKTKYEGNTLKQKNPYPIDQLSWATWVIARMGGWKGYRSERPPGPITMKRGLDKFGNYLDAWKLFRQE